MRAEAIRLLAGKAQSYEPQGEPGQGALTPEDVAAALGRAEPTASMLGRLVYAEQLEVVERLRSDLKVELAGDYRVQKWQLPRSEWLHDMISLALIEAMMEGQLPADHQALFMRMPFWTWNRKWRREYERVVVSLVQAWQDQLDGVMRRA